MSKVTKHTSIRLTNIAESNKYLFCYLVEDVITEDQAKTIIHRADSWLKTLKEIAR